MRYIHLHKISNYIPLFQLVGHTLSYENARLKNFPKFKNMPRKVKNFYF